MNTAVSTLCDTVSFSFSLVCLFMFICLVCLFVGVAVGACALSFSRSRGRSLLAGAVDKGKVDGNLLLHELRAVHAGDRVGGRLARLVLDQCIALRGVRNANDSAAAR